MFSSFNYSFKNGGRMKTIAFGDYILKSSSVNYYKVERIKGDIDSYIITLYLTNGSFIMADVISEEELEETTEELNRAMTEEK